MTNTSPASTDFGGPLSALIFGSLGAGSLFHGEWVDAAVWIALAGAFLAAPLRLDTEARLSRPRSFVAAILCVVAAALFVIRIALDIGA